MSGGDCGKVRYRDRVAAQMALLRAGQPRRNKATAVKRREARAYRCPDCRGWHLTSQQRGRP